MEKKTIENYKKTEEIKIDKDKLNKMTVSMDLIMKYRKNKIEKDFKECDQHQTHMKIK